MNTPTTQLATYLPAALAEIGPFAEIACASGMFGNSRPQEAIVKLMAGASWGVPPLQALSDIYVVKGKPMASGTLLRALVRKSGRFDYHLERLDDECATIAWYRLAPEGPKLLGRNSFSMADAKRAGYTSNATYQKTPRNMLLARCTSDGVKAYCPDVFMGSVYVPGEVPDDDPEPIRVKPTRTRTNPPEPRGPQPEAELVDEHRDPKPENAQAETAELLLTGEEIRAAREAIGLTMSDFGRAAGLTARQVSAVERGKAKDPELYARCGKALATAAPAAPPAPAPAPAPEPEPEPDEKPEPAEEPEPCPICAGRLPCSASAGCGGGRTLEAYERRERERKAEAVWALARTKLDDEDDLENVAARLDSCTTLDEIALVRSMVLALAGEEPKDQPKQTAPGGWRAAKAALDAELEPTDLEGLRAHVRELAREIRDDAKRAKLQALIDQAKDVARLEVLLASAERGLEAQRGDNSEGEVQLPPGMEHAAGEGVARG